MTSGPDQLRLTFGYGDRRANFDDLRRDHPALLDLTIQSSDFHDPADLEALAEWPSLTRLDLADNWIQAPGARILISSPTLTFLDLSQNWLDDLGAAALAQSPVLTWLDLAHNRIGNQGAKALAQNSSLTRLNLAFNKEIGDEGAKALAQSTSLEHLTLNWTRVGDLGVRALAQSQVLKTLSLEHVDLSSAGFHALAQSQSLTYLDLAGNKLDEESVSAFAENQTLRALSLIGVTWNGPRLEGYRSRRELEADRDQFCQRVGQRIRAARSDQNRIREIRLGEILELIPELVALVSGYAQVPELQIFWSESQQRAWEEAEWTGVD